MGAPSTLGTFLRGFTFGHVRQFDAVASRALIGLAEVVPGILAGSDATAMIDIDDTVKPVFGAAKQGAQHGYTHIKGLNAQQATISTTHAAPVIVGTRLRRGAAASARGAVRLVRDGLTTARRAGVTGQILVRADSAYYQHGFVTAVTKAGGLLLGRCPAGSGRAPGDRRHRPRVVGAHRVSEAVLDPDTGELVSCAEVAEVPYLTFTRTAAQPCPVGWSCAGFRSATPPSSPPRRRSPAPLVVAESQHRGHVRRRGRDVHPG